MRRTPDGGPRSDLPSPRASGPEHAESPDHRTASGSDHVELTFTELDAAALTAWASVPAAGAVVAFSGIVRDHAEGRDGVTALTYEAYEEPARARLSAVVDEARRRWPGLERVAVAHRLGRCELSDASVVVVVSAARFCIDTLKETVPIWKQEHWREGVDWGTAATPIVATVSPAEDG